MKTITHIIYTAVAVFALACFAVSPRAQAVSPPPDGCYPGFTTAEGCKALNFLTTGAGNTGIGWESLYVDTTGNFNTGVGAGALLSNNGDSNTAVGAVALLLNTTGSQNTAVGTDALVYNDTGSGNTATGEEALTSNTTGNNNTANGWSALHSNTEGGGNTGSGVNALFYNTTGFDNAAFGFQALNNTTGNGNTGVGENASYFITTGNVNTSLGFCAGCSLTASDNNIDVGNLGTEGDANIIRIGTVTPVTDPFGAFHPAHTATFIAGISGTAVVGDAVVVDANGQLGTATSSARFKKNIEPMENASEAILALKPVTFEYKSDSKGTPQFGLIAEEVAKVNPDLVVRDRNGEIYSVRYEAVNAMLLNEFLKEHRKVEQQEKAIAEQRKDFQASISKLEATIAQQRKDSESVAAQQQKQTQALTATVREQASQIQKVAAQVEMTRPAPQTVSLPAVALREGRNNQ